MAGWAVCWDAMVRDAWYAAAWSDELKARPLGRELFGRPVAMFRDAEGAARMLDAVCPHRGADLSRGRVVGGALACPYHGWTFDGRGLCTRVPSAAPEERIPPGARTRAYAVIEAQDIVWMWPGSGAPRGRPPHAALRDGAARRVRTAPRLWRAPFVHVMEQALDAAHVPFVHGRSTRSEGARVGAVELAWDDDRRGFTSETRGEAEPSVARGAWGRLTDAVLGLGPTRRRVVRYDVGGAVHVRIDYDAGWDALGILATPADADRTWVFGESGRTRGANPLADLLQHRYLAAIMEEDRIAAEALHTEGAREGFSSALSVAADRPTLAFRKLYEQRRAAE